MTSYVKTAGTIVTAITLGIVFDACKNNDPIRPATTNPPISIHLLRKDGCASFTNSRHPGNRIGYRFFEHTPLIWGAVPGNIPEQRDAKMVEEISTRNGVVIYEKQIEENQDWLSQIWPFYLAPSEDGIDMLWVIQSKESGLFNYYGVQQCFRMSGKSNSTWRREIAETPAFSEYDLWKSQTDMQSRTSLSWVLRNNDWQELPAMDSCVAAQTPLGIRMDSERFPQKPATVIGPYKGLLQESIDCGLITRADVAGEWICGMYWERTSHVTNHHPADCLHAIVNIGNLPANSKRFIRGKIYWFKGTKDDLLNKWRKDFPISSTE